MHNILMAGLAILLTFSIIGFSTEAAYAQLVPPAAATLVKTVDKPVVVSGTNVIYSYKITNTGQNDIFCGSVSDDKIGNIPVNALLKANQMITVQSASVPITQDVTNLATANCIADGGVILNPTSSTSVDVVNPSATIDKTASKTQNQVGVDPLQVTANTNVFYAIKVTNNGDVQLNNCQVSDPNLGGNVGASFNLAPNAMTTVFSAVAKQYVADFQNTASVSCAVPTTMGDSIGPISDTALVDVVNPSVTLDKTSNKDGTTTGLDPLQVVANTQVFSVFKATNNGDVPLNNCQVRDDNGTPGDTSDDFDVGTPFNLPNNGDMVTRVSASTAVSADRTNTGTVTCDDVAMFTPTATDTADVDVVNPSVTLDKTSNKDGTTTGVDPLQVLANTQVFSVFKATNNGDVPLNNCQVRDDNGTPGDTSDDFDVGTPFNLPNNGDMVTRVSASTAVSADRTNTGTVTCDDVAMFTPTATDTAFVDVVNIMLTLDKTSNKDGTTTGVDPLQVLANTQVFSVFKTTSNADVPLNNCQVRDDNGTPGDTSDDFDVGTSFNLPNNGDMVTRVSASTAVSADRTNTGTVTCDDVAMGTPTATDTAFVDVVNIMLTLDKTASETQGVIGVDPLQVKAGTNVFYAYKATSNADVPLNNCVVTDNLLGAIPGSFNLPNNGDMGTVFTNIPAQINQDTMNIGTVTCDDVAMGTPTATDTALVTVQFMPCVDIVKIADPSSIDGPETVKYTYDVTNCGDVALKQCNIDDDKEGAIGDPDFSLPIGGSKTFMKSVEISQTTKNTAKVLCLSDDEVMEMVMDSDMAQVILIFVGGEFLPINTAALFIGGIQSSAVWLVPALAGLAGTGYYLVKFRNKEE